MEKEGSQENLEKIPEKPQEEGVEMTEIEKELSLEIIKKIMEKAQDINAYGTAFTFIGRGMRSIHEEPEVSFKQNILKTILNKGLLGTSYDFRHEYKDISSFSKEIGDKGDIFAKKWVENVRKSKESEVHFNIIGKSTAVFHKYIKEEGHSLSEKRTIESIEEIDEYAIEDGNNIVLIFDLSKFKEEEVEISKVWTGEKTSFVQKAHTFRPKSSPSKIEFDLRDKNNKLLPSNEYGYTLSHRIAPRLFKGLVFRLDRWEKDDTEKKEKLFSEVLETMLNVYKEKPGLLIPIYDSSGNMWWPKQMSYEEVKKFVAERDKQENE